MNSQRRQEEGPPDGSAAGDVSAGGAAAGRASAGEPPSTASLPFVAELRRRITEGEGRRLEFKRGLPARWKVARTLASFANGVGGLLLVGIEDDGRVCGAPHPDETLAELLDVARREIDPPLEPWVWIVPFEDFRIVVAFVSRSARAPHRVATADSRVVGVVRRGASTCEVDEFELARAAEELDDLEPEEARVLAWLQRSTARGALRRTSATRTARATGLARSRVRRALAKLEHGGWVLGVGAEPGERLHLAATDTDGTN